MSESRIFISKKHPAYLSLSKMQIQHIGMLCNKISDGTYRFVDNPCICGHHGHDDLLLAHTDMFGIPADNVMCTKCGLIRSKLVPDQDSLNRFYTEDYKYINYNTEKLVVSSYFEGQAGRGRGYVALFKKYGLLGEISDIFDVGCGSGGVLYPFFQENKHCEGCDYGKDFIEYGNSKGLHLYEGLITQDKPDNNRYDLVILSHVLEHFTDHVSGLLDVINKVKLGKYLLIEVPGIFTEEAPVAFYPIGCFQFAHVVNFYHADFLSAFYASFGLEIIHADERCTFLLKRINETIEFRKDLLLNYQAGTIKEKILNRLQTSKDQYESSNYRLKINLLNFIRSIF